MKLVVVIKGRTYTIDTQRKSVMEYVLERGGEESGDIEGHELVGHVISVCA